MSVTMNDANSSLKADQAPQDSAASAAGAKLHWDASRLIHAVMLAVMAASVALSLKPYFGILVAFPVAGALTYAFSRLIKVAFGIDHEHGSSGTMQRIGAGVAAAIIGGVSVGLSSATIYRIQFGPASAVSHLESLLPAVTRQLEQNIADAKAARLAVEQWARASREKAEEEATRGGTCPARAGTGGKRGPIATFRADEATVASALSAELGEAVKTLEVATKAVPLARPANFAEAVATMKVANQAIRVANTFAKGSAISSSIDALQRREAAEIRWGDGTTFLCGDAARTEMLAKSREALEAIRKRPEMKDLKAEVDISNPQETSTRGLLRSFNSLAMIATFGLVGSYNGDVLMQKALKEGGVINREVMPMLLSIVIELSVVASAFFASRGGSAPYPFQPAPVLRALEELGKQPGLLGWLSSALGLLAKTVLNAVSSVKEQASGELSRARHGEGFWRACPDHQFGGEEGFKVRQPIGFAPEKIARGRLLLPYLYHWAGRDIVILPKDSNRVHDPARDAARMLTANGIATPIGDEVPHASLMAMPEFARRWSSEGAGRLNFEVSILYADFAYALREDRYRAVEAHDVSKSPSARPGVRALLQPAEIFH
jgi:hypothetical protein